LLTREDDIAGAGRLSTTTRSGPGPNRVAASHSGFDGFPSISADGKWMTFSSGRDAKPGTRELRQYLMDISDLDLGPRGLD